jgi:DNA-directed RNA polymerase subunit RPC12/RpoP
MGRAADVLREERRKVLGTSAAVCLRCGAARRWFEEFEAELPAQCPSCGGEILRRCASCTAPLASAFSVECDVCGAQLREPELNGMRIRRIGG